MTKGNDDAKKLITPVSSVFFSGYRLSLDHLMYK